MLLLRSSLALSTLFALPYLVPAITLDCKHIRAGQQDFNLERLGGPRSVHWIHGESDPVYSNWTFTVDICSNLAIPKDKKEVKCPVGTRVCGIRDEYNNATHNHIRDKAVGIAGDYQMNTGKGMDPVWTRLKHSSSNEDSVKEGLRLAIGGGKDDRDEKKPQRAVIEFICDRNRTGLEGRETDPEWNPVSDPMRRLLAREEADGEEDTKKDDGEVKSLTFRSYKDEEDEKKNIITTLRLDWRTEYACEHSDGSGDSNSSSHWGFFTWFIIILFLAIASYLIFGAWLNYNRYGARGWDLLPHGDTIRDLPYVLKDWARRVGSTIQGGGSRGGYSAV